ncbi:MAG: cache domain-containing protein, partial [Casimicrobiaceae bacterium]
MLRLRTLLALPFVGLILLPSLLIGAVSLYTGVRAADHLSRQLVTDISSRIERLTVYQLQEASMLLSTAFPSLRQPDPTVLRAQADIEVLAERLFATLLSSRTASYIYFARSDGAFVGVDRSNPSPDAPAIQRVQRDPTRPRTVYALDPSGQRLRLIETESRLFRAPERPWFVAALDRGRLSWTPVYRSFASGQMVTTASLPVRDGEGHLLGIAAADIVLSELSDFMRGLRVSANGVAFIVDGTGRLVAQ